MNKAVFILSAALVLGVIFGSCYSTQDGFQRLVELHPELADASTPDGGGVATRCRLAGDAGVFDGGPKCNVDFGSYAMDGISGHWAMCLAQDGTMEPVRGAGTWNLTVNDIFTIDIGDDKKTAVMTFATQYPVADGNPKKLQTTIYPQLRQALDQNNVLVRIPLAGDGTFAAPNIPWFWGVHVELMPNPLTDPLPSIDDLSDPRIWDQDNDSLPGVTVGCKVVLSPMIKTEGNRYMSRRSIWQFSNGAVMPDKKWYKGDLGFVINESALGGTTSELKTIAPITPNPTGSYYLFRKIKDEYDAEWLSACWPAVFQDAPPD